MQNLKTPNEIIGQKIQQIREALNLTQVDLAGQVGFKEDTIKKIENARFNASIGELTKILDILEYQLVLLPKIDYFEPALWAEVPFYNELYPDLKMIWNQWNQEWYVNIGQDVWVLESEAHVDAFLEEFFEVDDIEDGTYQIIDAGWVSKTAVNVTTFDDLPVEVAESIVSHFANILGVKPESLEKFLSENDCLFKKTDLGYELADPDCLARINSFFIKNPN